VLHVKLHVVLAIADSDKDQFSVLFPWVHTCCGFVTLDDVTGCLQAACVLTGVSRLMETGPVCSLNQYVTSALCHLCAARAAA
jgi:hypothetical protein